MSQVMETSTPQSDDEPMEGGYKAFWVGAMLLSFGTFVVGVGAIGACLLPVFRGEFPLIEHPIFENLVGLSLASVAMLSLSILVFGALNQNRSVQYVKPDFESRSGFWQSLAGIRPEVLVIASCIALGWLV